MTRRTLTLTLALFASVSNGVAAQPPTTADADAGTALPTDRVDASTAIAAPTDAGVAPADPEPVFDLDESHRPRIRVRVDRASIETGDTVQLEVVADALASDDVTVPSQSFAPFEVHARNATQRPRGDRREYRFVLTLLALEPGQVTIPGVELRVLTAEGDVGVLRTESRAIEVRSRIANEPNATAKGPSAPRTLIEENPVPKYVIGAVLAMMLGALIALALRRWWKRRPKVEPPPPPPRPPWELAFAKLEALRRDGQAMVAEGRVEPWIDALSDVVREYLGKRYGFDGLECTSGELLDRVRALRATQVSASELEVFLGECDLVKFAKGSVTEEQAEAMYKSAHRLVTRTIPSYGELPQGAS